MKSLSALRSKAPKATQFEPVGVEIGLAVERAGSVLSELAAQHAEHEAAQRFHRPLLADTVDEHDGLTRLAHRVASKEESVGTVHIAEIKRIIQQSFDLQVTKTKM